MTRQEIIDYFEKLSWFESQEVIRKIAEDSGQAWKSVKIDGIPGEGEIVILHDFEDAYGVVIRMGKRSFMSIEDVNGDRGEDAWFPIHKKDRWMPFPYDMNLPAEIDL